MLLRDAQSGEVLAIIKDSKAAGTTTRLNTSASNLADVRRAFADWARQLRKGLDFIHGGESTSP